MLEEPVNEHVGDVDEVTSISCASGDKVLQQQPCSVIFSNEVSHAVERTCCEGAQGKF